jgi:hypothetical protein
MSTIQKIGMKMYYVIIALEVQEEELKVLIKLILM